MTQIIFIRRHHSIEFFFLQNFEEILRINIGKQFLILGGPPTVKGDDRMTNFKTSHGDQFQGKWEKPVQTLPAVSDPVRLREGLS